MLGWKLLWSTPDLFKWVVLRSRFDRVSSSKLHPGCIMASWKIDLNCAQLWPWFKQLAEISDRISGRVYDWMESCTSLQATTRCPARLHTFQVMEELWRSWDIVRLSTRPDEKQLGHWFLWDAMEQSEQSIKCIHRPTTDSTWWLRFPWSNSRNSAKGHCNFQKPPPPPTPLLFKQRW